MQELEDEAEDGVEEWWRSGGRVMAHTSDPSTGMAAIASLDSQSNERLSSSSIIESS